jgi:RNA polymerase sigma factor (sigma-70 family)
MRLRRGSTDAIAEAYARHGRMVHGICRRMLGNAADADEATQAVFVLLAAQAPPSDRRDLGGWCGRAAFNAARSLRRAQRRRAIHERAAVAAGRASRGHQPSEAQAALEEELASLRVALRRPLTLVYLEGVAPAEAARRLGIADTALRRRLSDGRAELRRALRRRGFRMREPALAAALGRAAGEDACAPRTSAPAHIERAARLSFRALAQELSRRARRPALPRSAISAMAAAAAVLGFVWWLAPPHPAGDARAHRAVAPPSASAHAPASEPPVRREASTLPDGPPIWLGDAQSAQPNGGRVVLWSRAHWHNYPLASYDFSRGLRADHVLVRNKVQLVFANQNRLIDQASPAIPIPERFYDICHLGEIIQDPDTQRGEPDTFRIRSGLSVSILPLGHVDLAGLTAAPAMDQAGESAAVERGASYALVYTDFDSKALRAVAFTVVDWRADDAVLIDWRPIAPPPVDQAPPALPRATL